MPPVPPAAASAASGHLDTRTAAHEVAETLHAEIGDGCDLVVICASFHHRAAIEEAARTIRGALQPKTMLGVTAESVLGGGSEFEGLAGIAAVALRVPGMELHPWISTPEDPIPVSRPEEVPERIGLRDDTRGVMLLGDPFTTPVTKLLPALADLNTPNGPLRVVGGMASGASQAGHNALILDDQLVPQGAIGVTISGKLRLDTVVSQGCRPIGRPLVVTKAHKNVILELGGNKAQDVLRETAGELAEDERHLLGGGVLVGNVIDEHRTHWGRGDFLVRNMLGLHKETNGLVVADLPRVGQTIQFHVRDAATASEDLQLLLDAQQLHGAPLAGLLFTCNGRGRRLFDETGHDTSIIRERLGDFPMAGFFAAGEIGPIGGRSFLHGHTACLVLVRAGRV